MPGTAGPPSPPGQHLRAGVDSTLAGFLDEKRTMLAAMHPSLLPVIDQLAALYEGGSLRPAFAYWAWRGFTGDLVRPGTPDRGSDEVVLRAVSALEFLRIGARAHQRAWDGDAQGTGAWILIGDLALVWSDELLHGSGLSAPALDCALSAWEGMRTETTAAQYLGLLRAAGGGGSGGCGCTIRRLLLFGAALAGADSAAAAVCTGIGAPLDDAVALRQALRGRDSAAEDRVASDIERARQAIAAAPISGDARAALDALAVAATSPSGR